VSISTGVFGSMGGGRGKPASAGASTSAVSEPSALPSGIASAPLDDLPDDDGLDAPQAVKAIRSIVDAPLVDLIERRDAVPLEVRLGSDELRRAGHRTLDGSSRSSNNSG
jgi:hypothetical protein